MKGNRTDSFGYMSIIVPILHYCSFREAILAFLIGHVVMFANNLEKVILIKVIFIRVKIRATA